MKTINIDIETFSSINISKSGVYKYVESEDFEVLLFAYSIDGGKTEIVDIANGEELSEEIIQVLLDDNVIKWAFNAQFERICLSRFLKLTKGTYLNPKSWRCTMIWSAYMGLPFSLEGVGKVLGLEKQKLIEGKDLIKYFCVPCTPTKSNGFRNRNFPYHDKIKWEAFKTYNIRDVDTEKEIQCKLMKFPVPDFIWEEYNLDQEINDRGIKVDLDFVERVIALDDKVRTKLMSELQILTELENPNSVVQLKGWLSEQGVETESLDKKSVKELVKVTKGEVSKALALRMQLSKSSIKKYQAMKDVACEDNRCRGMFQFLGANRTGRFSGRNVQLQNLPRNTMKELFEVRSIIKNRNGDILELLYDNVPDILSQLIRTAFVPKENMKFYVADFSSIEARVIAWLAGETWREELFKKGGDIYCMSASQMFGVPVVKHGINGDLRQKGKIAELACGYGGSVGALTAMGALDMGLKEDELKPLVLSWREANQNIVALWWTVDKAIKDAIAMKGVTKTHGIEFECRSGLLRIRLPSGRKLTYIKPKIEINKFGCESVTYEGIGVAKKWERIESYGPKFVENIVQAISRDILIYALQNLSDYNIVAHVHDEIIIEAPENTKLEDICGTMSQAPYWAKGLILTADGYTCDFYMKD
ncbi:DNA polymerase [Gemella sanguinis]|jgi:DNA-directed DNA polymerase|uniref:DNA polymerase n=1 Tax=Gemella sanguinis TaxID=84135 RepID=UPI0028ED17C9|nr:DNA polymerase [Gemella sanguinis]